MTAGLARRGELRRVLVVQHVPYEPLGTLDPLLRARKVRVRYVNFSRHPDARPDVAGYDALIVLGGPMNVRDRLRLPHLDTELRLIDGALRAGIPILGICLGAQLLAHALGAAVQANPVAELGWHEVRLTPQGRADPVLAELGDRAPIFHWHADTFELPGGAQLLAESDLCPRQAYSYQGQAWGLQFHLEVDEQLIGRWLQVYHAELARAHGPAAAARIAGETARHIQGAKALSDRLFSRLLGEFGWREREPGRHLGHGARLGSH